MFFEINLKTFWDNSTLGVLNSFLPNFSKHLKNHLAANIKGTWVRGWGKMASGRCKIRELPAG